MLRSTEEGPINDGQSNIQHKEVASAKHLVPNVSVDYPGGVPDWEEKDLANANF